MSSRPIVNAVQCPVCQTWVADALVCSWCTVELATGSWRFCDPLLVARTLRRLPPSKYECRCHTPERRRGLSVGVAA